MAGIGMARKYVNVSTALNGVKDSFKKLILSDEMKPHFIKALNAIDPMNISPATHDIFHFAKYIEIPDIRVVIVGQDPYPDPSHAHGLCFSSLDERVPASLKNIYLCLERSGLLCNPVDEIKTSNLTRWAQQGVLMLNMSLTTEKWKSATHMDLWHPITTHIIKTIGAADTPVIFLLWGSFAKKMRQYISSPHAIILEEIHPSPMAQAKLPQEKKFVNCDHFTRVNAILKAANMREIIWDPTAPLKKNMIKVYTDGSGLNTKDVNSRASYASLFPSTGLMLFGRLSPMMIIDISMVEKGEDWDPEQNPCWFDDARGYTIGGKHCDTKSWPEPLATSYLSNVERQVIFPTSQRGEGMAILMALEHVVNIGDPCHLHIVTDSMFWKQMIEKYIPSWVSQNRPFSLQCNPDLVTRIWNAMKKMAASNMTIEIQHIKSHGKDKYADSDDIRFNDIVDKKARAVRDSDLYGDHREIIDL